MGRLLAKGRSVTASKKHVVSGLIEKRRELAGIIDELQRQLDQHRADLTHIDGTLRVLAVVHERAVLDHMIVVLIYIHYHIVDQRVLHYVRLYNAYC